MAVGADAVLRFWDCHSGNCLEHDMTTYPTASAAEGSPPALCAVAVAPDNAIVVTADTTGSIAVWDISSTHSALRALATSAAHRQPRPGSAVPAAGIRASLLASHGVGGGACRPISSNNISSSRPQSAASSLGSPRAFGRPSAASRVCTAQQAVGIVKLATWKAHTDTVTAVAWVAAAALPAAAAEERAVSSGFILSAGLDRSMVMWSSRGARVGTFGCSSWVLHDSSTYQDITEHSCGVSNVRT